MEEFEEDKENKLGAEQLDGKEWSKMIGEILKSQDWRRTMDLTIFNPLQKESCEIEEVMDEKVDDIDIDKQIYVAVGKNSSALLQWALNNLVKEGDSVTLIHVFPPLKSIPTPVGKLPISQVSEDIVAEHMKEEVVKTRRLLQNYLDMCSKVKIKAKTMIIESDMPHKLSLVQLISKYKISKLVMGTKPAVHPMIRKLKERGQSTAEYVERHAPHFCDLFVACEGKAIFYRTS